MKSINIYLTYATVAALFILITPPVSADFQCDQANKDSHIPYDANNTDNELFLTTPVMANWQVGNTQSCEVFEEFEFTIANMPFELQPLLDLAPGQCIRIGSADALRAGCTFYQVDNETCTLTDVNGNARQTNTYYSTFTKLSNASNGPTGYGENLITDSAGWDTLEQGWTVVSADILSADSVTDANALYLTTEPLEEGALYQMKFTISDYTAGEVRPTVQWGSEANRISGDGNYTVNLSAGAGIRSGFRGYDGFTATISNISLRRAFIDASGDRVKFRASVFCSDYQ